MVSACFPEVNPSNDSFAHPLYQWVEIGKAFLSIPLTICERTHDAFQKVQFLKVDENGAVVDMPLDGRTNQYSNRKFAILDLKTGQMYIDEDQSTVAFKCVVLFFGLPIYSVIRSVCNANKTLILTAAVGIKLISEIGENFLKHEFVDGLKLGGKGLVELGTILGLGIYDLFKSQVCCVLAQSAVLYGIFRPFYGRKIEAVVEKAWNNGVNYKKALEYFDKKQGDDKKEALCDGLIEILDNFDFAYLANCFQPRRNILTTYENGRSRYQITQFYSEEESTFKKYVPQPIEGQNYLNDKPWLNPEIQEINQ